MVRRFAAILVGLLLLQAAWVLAVVPFRGIDEHQHVFRADSVAHGDWAASERVSPDGWGELVSVRDDVVEAAYVACEKRGFTTPELCRGYPEAGTGRTLVASTAARYNPTYYALVGYVGQAFDGMSALYAMRAWSALLCAVVTALALTIYLQGRRTRSPGIAALLVLTPIWAYSSTLVAPNGLEMASAFLLWACLLRLATGTPAPLRQRTLLVLATAAGAALMTLRTLGPLWCVLIVAAVAVLAGHRRVLALRHHRAARWAVAVVAVAALGGVLWSATSGTNSLAYLARDHPGSPLLESLRVLGIYWLPQAIAVFPDRFELAPLATYVFVLVAWLTASVRFVRRAPRRAVVTWLLVLAAVIAVPLGFTTLTWSAQGFVWQARYGYPFTMGAMLLGGLVLDRLGRRDDEGPTVLPAVLAGFAMTVAMGFALVGVRKHQIASHASFADVGVSAPPAVLLVVLATAGLAVLWGAMCYSESCAPTTSTADPTADPLDRTAGERRDRRAGVAG